MSRQARLTGCNEQQDPSDENKEVGENISEFAHYAQLVVWFSGSLSNRQDWYIYLDARLTAQVDAESCGGVFTSHFISPNCAACQNSAKHPIPIYDVEAVTQWNRKDLPFLGFSAVR